MNDLSLSYRKVRYDLRPAKQVERLMLIDALRRLASCGFRIADYQYTGMGSVHFYDFSLLHRYAGIWRMLSVEASRAIKKRVEFNCPYALIDVKLAKIGSVIRKVDPALDHLMWLDYDSTLQVSYLADVTQAISHCKPGSIIIITVDTEPPKALRSSKQIRDHFVSVFGDLLPANQRLANFTPKQLPWLNAQLIWRAIQRGLNGQDENEFQLLFHFLYKDGHRMLTVGGMLVNEDVRRRLQSSTLSSTCYIRTRIGERPYQIRVPVITRKERLYLDSAMPCADDWMPDEFEIGKRDLRAYRDIYRFAPQFAELIL